GTMQGLAWSADDEELWFAAAKENIDRSLFGISLSGKLRSILYAPAPLGLHDISAAGDVLLSRVSHRRPMIGRFANDSRERDLSWLNWSLPRALSPDGKKLLFVEQHGAPSVNKVCVRLVDGSPPVVLGEGMAMQFSPDEKFILTLIEGNQLALLPVGPGKQKILDTVGLACHWAAWFPDG